MRVISIIIGILTLIGCARQNESVSDRTQFLNAYALNLLKANDPNALDKIVYSRADIEGTTVTRINSTNQDFYIYVSLQTNSQLPASLASSTCWDIAFNRYKIATNSGSTNSSGNGGVCQSTQTNVGSAGNISKNDQGCLDGNFSVDGKSSTQGVGGTVGDFIGSSLLSDWFNYQIGNLTTKGLIYIIRSGNGNQYFAIKIESYYSEAGTSGYPTIRWKKLP